MTRQPFNITSKKKRKSTFCPILGLNAETLRNEGKNEIPEPMLDINLVEKGFHFPSDITWSLKSISKIGQKSTNPHISSQFLPISKTQLLLFIFSLYKSYFSHICSSKPSRNTCTNIAIQWRSISINVNISTQGKMGNANFHRVEIHPIYQHPIDVAHASYINQCVPISTWPLQTTTWQSSYQMQNVQIFTCEIVVKSISTESIEHAILNHFQSETL